MEEHRLPIIDTGPLLDFLFIRCNEELGWKHLSGAIQFLKSHRQIKRFEDFLKTKKPILTTPGVIAEIQSGSRREKCDQPRFWRFARNELLNIGIQEDIIRLAEMIEGDVISFGPVDASLLKLLKEKLSHGGFLVTSDESLWRRCHESLLRVKWLQEIIEE